MRPTLRKVPRFTVGKLMGAIALIAIVMGLLVVPMGRHAEWSRLNRQMASTLRGLRPTNPAAVNADVWECALTKTTIAHMNICYNFGEPSTAEMYRLRDDLDEKLKGDVDLDTLVWIYDRLARTGPNGRRYVEHFKPWFLECFPAPK